MAGRKRSAPTRSSPRATRSRATASAKSQNAVPNVFREMLSEAKATKSRQNDEPSEPPPKRRKRPGEKPEPKSPPKKGHEDVDDSSDNDDDLEFEDVVIPTPTIQTMLREDSEEEDDDDIQFEDVGVDPDTPSAVPVAQGSGELSLNLTIQMDAMATRRAAERRKVIGREEKERRVEVHKMHLLCLLSHVERRNRWCNDAAVQDALRPLLTDKMVRLLNPRPTLIQFGRMESLKNGLLETSAMFKPKFKITERGLRRALWPEDEEQLKDYKLPDDTETTFEKSDFLEAAKSLQGSRDVGAQLFCALLRCAGVEARLVSSLQPLSFAPGAPTMPKQRKTEIDTAKRSKGEIYAAAMAKYETAVPNPSPRRRLGHPNAAAYNIPSLAPPPPSREAAQSPKRIRESPFPVFWVEVLDISHQKWHPIDAIVTGTQWRPRALEPPANDRENCMTYVVAFEADGSARDVTRRYAKAYNSKTKRMRIDGMSVPANRTPIAPTTNEGRLPLNPGERWWRRALRRYRRPTGYSDLDQIEVTELIAEEAKEPMPRNVADFKDHPVYALERHLRRYEVLVPGAQSSGTVGAGSKAPLERIYRRRDVRIARSRERWYRLGRVIKPGEEAVKILPKRHRRKSRFGDDDEEEDDDPDKVGLFGEAVAGTPIYMMEQTDLYHAPPVVNGRVPRNRFGNLDVYVPSMVPAGGVHILHERAAHAAFILGVDYAPALTGFEFKGRKGTAVLKGAVVPKECEEGVWAVIEGLRDLEQEMEEERRSRRALRMWSRFLKTLRIRERIHARVDEDAEEEGEEEVVEEGGKGKGKGKEVARDEEEDEDMDMAGAVSDVSEEYFMEDDGEGGGFLVVDDDDLGGGFVVE